MPTLESAPPITVLAGLLGLQAAYLLCTVWFRDRIPGSRPVSGRQLWLFSEGIVVLFLALASPLHVLSDHYLFTAHMVQHLLLTFVAAPLLLAGTPDWLFVLVLQKTRLLGVARAARHPVIAFGAFNVVFLLTHAPRLYELGLSTDALHAVEHLLFLGTAMLFWMPVLSPAPAVLPRYPYLGQLAMFFAETGPSAVLGAFLAHAPAPLYPTYELAPRIVPALTPLFDQQLGGLIMWVGGTTFFLGALGVVFYLWQREEQAADRLAAYRARPHVP